MSLMPVYQSLVISVGVIELDIRPLICRRCAGAGGSMNASLIGPTLGRVVDTVCQHEFHIVAWLGGRRWPSEDSRGRSCLGLMPLLL